MKNFLLGIFLGSFISIALAGKISTPPPLSDISPALQAYLKEISQNINKFQITTSAPDGTRKGVKGEPILYNNSGSFTLWINIDGDIDWQQI